MEKWDSNKWQGKKRKQVDYSHGLAFVGFTLLFLMLIILGIFYSS